MVYPVTQQSTEHLQVHKDSVHLRRCYPRRRQTALLGLTPKGLPACIRWWGIPHNIHCHHLDGVHSPSLQPTEHCAGGSRWEQLRSGATAGDCSHCVPSDGRSVIRQCGRGPCDSDGRARGSHGGHTTRWRGSWEGREGREHNCWKDREQQITYDTLIRMWKVIFKAY